jgi:translation initiation factor IF-1
MAKEGLIEMTGVVHEVLPDSRYRMKLDNGHVVPHLRPHAQAPHPHHHWRQHIAGNVAV